MTTKNTFAQFSFNLQCAKIKKMNLYIILESTKCQFGRASTQELDNEIKQNLVGVSKMY